MSENTKKKTVLWISLAGLSVLLTLYVYWILTDQNVNIAGYTASFISVVLFAIICIKSLNTFLSSFLVDYKEYKIHNASNRRKIFIIFAVFLLIDVLDLWIIHIIRIVFFNDTTSFMEGLNLFLHIDTGYYLKIAEQWYVATPEYIYDLVFFPGFPIFIRLMNFAVGNYLLSATIVSGLFYAGSACLLYELLLLDYDEHVCVNTLKYFALLPAAFFFSAPMSESMFIFFSLLSVFLARKDKWIWAVLAGAVSAFTRSLGALTIVPLLVIAVSNLVKNPNNRGKWIKAIIYCSIVLTGTLGYLIINYIITGNPLAFTNIQFEKWGQSLGLFFDSTAFQIDNALADLSQPYYTNSLGIWLPNVAYCFAVLLLMTLSSGSVRSEYSIWFICYYVVAIGATYLISAPRYLVACVPVYPALATTMKNKKLDCAFTLLCIISAIYYIYAFSARWEVF